MDLCHCSMPQLARNEKGELFCERCGLWHNEAAYKRDPRVKRAQAKLFSDIREVDELVESIMAVGRKKK